MLSFGNYTNEFILPDLSRFHSAFLTFQILIENQNRGAKANTGTQPGYDQKKY